MLYTLTIGLSAFLLFLVQPLISKMLLPSFGGGASTWITSLVFFQAVLLAGYGTTHLVVKQFGLRRHLAFSLAILLASLLFLPVSASLNFGAEQPPAIRLFMLLFMSVGVPYFVLSTMSPTIQYWIANDVRTHTQNPYVQYGVSNLGSLGGLLAYPFLVEPFLTNSQQSWTWTTIYLGFACMLASCVILFAKHNRSAPVAVDHPDVDLDTTPRLRWLFLAMLPSALLLVTTHHLTLDVVNLPLLWIAPLCVYLVTFILCFLFPRLSRPTTARALIGVCAVLFLMVANHGFYDFGFEVKIAAGLTCLFVVGMIFHGDLERAKPHKNDLTGFYLQVAAGGCLGSIFAGVLAPLVFKSTFEFYVVAVVALYYVVVSAYQLRRGATLLFRASIILAILASFVRQETTLDSETVFRARSFYSTYAVREPADFPGVRRLVAGTHVHGVELIDNPLTPLSYYHEKTGVSHMFEMTNPARIGAIGLGIGSVVAFGEAGDEFDLYELDPIVVELAKNQFDVLGQSRAELNYFVGDGRLQIRQAPEHVYDMLILDAFTSGSIPMHLVTLEAIDELLAKLKADGTILYHISNSHIDLLPVLNAIADELDISILYHQSSGEDRLNHFPTRWVVMTPDSELAGRILEEDRGWRPPPIDKQLWRDEFSNIWSVLK